MNKFYKMRQKSYPIKYNEKLSEFILCIENIYFCTNNVVNQG